MIQLLALMYSDIALFNESESFKAFDESMSPCQISCPLPL